MLIERGIHGNWFISDIIGDTYAHKQYIGYTKKQAIREFKREFYPMKTRYTVTFNGSTHDDCTVRVLAKSEHDAIDRAVSKIFGAYAWWWPDSGLSYEYGQVPVPQKLGGGNSCLTGRVHWRVVEGWKK